jgi:sporulation protein YlmC with PRC-barrel domain
MFTHQPTRQDEELVTGYIGHEVLDERGLHLGHVTEVVYSPQDAHPEYLVVDPGLMRPAHYVPVAGSYHTATGQIVVPWDKHWVKTATKAVGGHALGSDARADLAHHYTTD